MGGIGRAGITGAGEFVVRAIGGCVVCGGTWFAGEDEAGTALSAGAELSGSTVRVQG